MIFLLITPSLTMRTTSVTLKGHPAKHLPSHLPQNCQGHEKGGTSEKLSQPRGIYGDVMAKCNLISWRESWSRKGTLGRKQGNLNKLLHLFNNNASKCSLIVAKVPTIQMQDAQNRGNGMGRMGILYCFLSFSVTLTIF